MVSNARSIASRSVSSSAATRRSCTLPANLHDRGNHGLSTSCKSNSLDASICIVLTTRKNSGPVKRIDGTPSGGHGQRYAEGEIVHGQVFSCPIKLKKYAALRKRQIEIGSSGHDFRLAAFEHRHKCFHQFGGEHLDRLRLLLHTKQVYCAYATIARPHIALMFAIPGPYIRDASGTER